MKHDTCNLKKSREADSFIANQKVLLLHTVLGFCMYCVLGNIAQRARMRSHLYLGGCVRHSYVPLKPTLVSTCEVYSYARILHVACCCVHIFCACMSLKVFVYRA